MKVTNVFLFDKVYGKHFEYNGKELRINFGDKFISFLFQENLSKEQLIKDLRTLADAIEKME